MLQECNLPETKMPPCRMQNAPWDRDDTRGGKARGACSHREGAPRPDAEETDKTKLPKHSPAQLGSKT